MESENRTAAAARLGIARHEEATAANEHDAAHGTAAEFHTAVQLNAAKAEVSARAAWLAWSDDGGDDR